MLQTIKCCKSLLTEIHKENLTLDELEYLLNFADKLTIITDELIALKQFS